MVGFFAVGVVNFLILRATGQAAIVKSIGSWMLFAGLFLMTMGMAGLGLLVDYARIREHGLRASLAFVVGWFGLLAFASAVAGCWDFDRAREFSPRLRGSFWRPSRRSCTGGIGVARDDESA